MSETKHTGPKFVRVESVGYFKEPPHKVEGCLGNRISNFTFKILDIERGKHDDPCLLCIEFNGPTDTRIHNVPIKSFYNVDVWQWEIFQKGPYVWMSDDIGYLKSILASEIEDSKV